VGPWNLLLERAAARLMLSLDKFKQVTRFPQVGTLLRIRATFGCLLFWIGAFLRLFRSRQNLLVENLALRQQVAMFKRQPR
jgi:hypothetical protein